MLICNASIDHPLKRNVHIRLKIEQCLGFIDDSESKVPESMMRLRRDLAIFETNELSHNDIRWVASKSSCLRRHLIGVV